jgi:triacylglycerol lipase
MYPADPTNPAISAVSAIPADCYARDSMSTPRTALVPALVIAALSSACTAPVEHARDATREPEVVVLVHGFGPTTQLIGMLGRRLAAEGFRIENFEYASMTAPLADSGVDLRRELERVGADPDVRRVHLVTHSMGGVVARHALAPGAPPKLGRVVMLAPPHRGAPLAEFFAPLVGGWLAPLRDLRTGEASPAETLPPIEGVDVGVLAAEHDLTVPVEYTALEGARDFLLLRGGLFAASHNGMLVAHDETLPQILHFLDHATFARPRPQTETARPDSRPDAP